MPKGKAKAVEREHSSQFTKTGQARYRPLAPKEITQGTHLSGPLLPIYHFPVWSANLSAKPENGQSRSQSPASESSKQRELTFINVTDPAQSQSQATRRFVRTQVMKIYAREKRLRETVEHQGQPIGSHPAGSKNPSFRVGVPVCQCPQPDPQRASKSSASKQRLCKRCGRAVPSASDSIERSQNQVHHSLPAYQASQLEFGPSATRLEHSLLDAESTTLAEVSSLQWPVSMDPEMLILIANGMPLLKYRRHWKLTKD